MNRAIQSFLLKTICFILLINVTFCRSCSKLRCAAGCYYSNSGFDYGYCEKNGCKCSPPVIYLFNGIESGLSGEYTYNSWENNNQNKNSVTKAKSYHEQELETSTMHSSNENKRNKIWEEIVTKITEEYSYIKKDDLQNLKSKIIGNQSALSNFYMYLKNPLKDALELMKNIHPDTSQECDELLELLRKQEYAKKSAALTQTVRRPQASLQGLPIKQSTSDRKLTTSSSKNLPSKSNDSISKKPKENNDKNKTTNDKNVNDSKEKNNFKRTVVEEEEQKKHEIFYEISEETVEYNDESDENPKQNKEKVTVKPQTQKKTKEILPPIKNEIDNSGSGSYYDDSLEENQSTNNVTPKKL